MANSIAKIDLNKDEPTMERLSSGITGHRDGKIAESRFNQPAQIYSDSDGNIYIADCNNHCIRRITPEDQVETVLGVPGQSGWKDGTKDEALFKNPRGIGISKDGSVYVADFGNRRIRKLSIN
jgi:DNA-binding beta-propeller fold protein YncE